MSIQTKTNSVIQDLISPFNLDPGYDANTILAVSPNGSKAVAIKFSTGTTITGGSTTADFNVMDVDYVSMSPSITMDVDRSVSTQPIPNNAADITTGRVGNKQAFITDVGDNVFLYLKGTVGTPTEGSKSQVLHFKWTGIEWAVNYFLITGTTNQYSDEDSGIFVKPSGDKIILRQGAHGTTVPSFVILDADLNTGTLTQVGTGPFDITGCTSSHYGVLFSTDLDLVAYKTLTGLQVATIDLGTGVVTPLDIYPENNVLSILSLDTNGLVYTTTTNLTRLSIISTAILPTFGTPKSFTGTFSFDTNIATNVGLFSSSGYYSDAVVLTKESPGIKIFNHGNVTILSNLLDVTGATYYPYKINNEGPKGRFYYQLDLSASSKLSVVQIVEEVYTTVVNADPIVATTSLMTSINNIFSVSYDKNTNVSPSLVTPATGFTFTGTITNSPNDAEFGLSNFTQAGFYENFEYKLNGDVVINPNRLNKFDLIVFDAVALDVNTLSETVPVETRTILPSSKLGTITDITINTPPSGVEWNFDVSTGLELTFLKYYLPTTGTSLMIDFTMNYLEDDGVTLKSYTGNFDIPFTPLSYTVVMPKITLLGGSSKILLHNGLHGNNVTSDHTLDFGTVNSTPIMQGNFVIVNNATGTTIGTPSPNDTLNITVSGSPGYYYSTTSENKLTINGSNPTMTGPTTIVGTTEYEFTSLIFSLGSQNLVKPNQGQPNDTITIMPANAINRNKLSNFSLLTPPTGFSLQGGVGTATDAILIAIDDTVSAQDYILDIQFDAANNSTVTAMIPVTVQTTTPTSMAVPAVTNNGNGSVTITNHANIAGTPAQPVTYTVTYTQTSVMPLPSPQTFLINPGDPATLTGLPQGTFTITATVGTNTSLPSAQVITTADQIAPNIFVGGQYSVESCVTKKGNTHNIILTGKVHGTGKAQVINDLITVIGNIIRVRVSPDYKDYEVDGTVLDDLFYKFGDDFLISLNKTRNFIRTGTIEDPPAVAATPIPGNDTILGDPNYSREINNIVNTFFKQFHRFMKNFYGYNPDTNDCEEHETPSSQSCHKDCLSSVIMMFTQL